ncbi:uncharacterized protein TNCV_3138171 [Trichonephila clavipes]|nr:uncharacterized protein TNCV_3138171 [Trichonephila clavipes]
MNTLQEYYDLKVLNRSNHRLDRLVDFVAHTNDYKLRKFRSPSKLLPGFNNVTPELVREFKNEAYAHLKQIQTNRLEYGYLFNIIDEKDGISHAVYIKYEQFPLMEGYVLPEIDAIANKLTQPNTDINLLIESITVMASSLDFDSEFERVLSLIFPPDNFPDLYWKIFNFNWLSNPYHLECFRKHCVDTGHSMQELCRLNNFLQEIWKEDITCAYLVGFLHDIAKPLVERTNGLGQQSFRGHAQVGARLVTLRFQDEIPKDVLLTMGVLIDCHMCCLRNLSSSTEHCLRVNAVLHMYLPHIPHIFSLLMCLHAADQLSKQPPFQADGYGYLYQSPFTFRKDRRVVIFLLGPTGSGKSTIARALAEDLASCGSVLHLQRDGILMKLAQEGESYTDCYNRIQNTPGLKRQLQTLWKECLDSASADIILVDTCQTYYWSHTIEFINCFRIGVYCVPFNLIDTFAHWRNPRIEFPPTKWSGYPTLLTEQCPWQLDVGTGLWNLVPSIVQRYFNQSWPESLDNHPSLATLWNESNLSLQHLCTISSQRDPF